MARIKRNPQEEFQFCLFMKRWEFDRFFYVTTQCGIVQSFLCSLFSLWSSWRHIFKIVYLMQSSFQFFPCVTFYLTQPCCDLRFTLEGRKYLCCAGFFPLYPSQDIIVLLFMFLSSVWRGGGCSVMPSHVSWFNLLAVFIEEWVSSYT